MGYGSYTAGDWAKLKTSRGLSSSSNANQTFSRTTIDDKYNAVFVDKRESIDSEDSPNSTPVIIGFDATGSMGYLANEIATNSLNEAIMQILTRQPVSDPHMLCSAFTDNKNPLQVTQFEADIRVVEQLLDFKLGGGNRYSYDTVLWYFAANHTKTDCFEKRGKKGILIGIGDEICGGKNNILSREDILRLFGDKMNKDYNLNEIFRMVSQKYEVAHIVVGGEERFNSNLSNWNRESYSGWNQAIPGRVAKLKANDIGSLAEVIVAIMEMLTGKDKAAVIDEAPEDKKEVLKFALEDFQTVNSDSSQTILKSLFGN